ncbi:MAG: DUF692 domain-containing protein [Rubrivivax sp.]|nr:DUF692 domain-containing protein [Rubrivivax sp.]
MSAALPARSEPAPWAGFGFKPAHAAALLARPPAQLLQGAAFLEVHAENYMVSGGPALRQLQQLRERWPLSIHGVGLSIGGEEPLDEAHLQRLQTLVQRFQPRWFSEHLAWSSHAGRCFNDLLPLPYHAGTLQRVCTHVQQVQDRLRRPMLLENPSTYLEWADSTMDEAGFLAEVVRRTGCGLLLDVNNAYVSGINHARDPWDFIAALPAQAVAQIHLAGFAEEADAAGRRLLIDHHGAPVDDAVWALYARTLDRLGPVPTLIERDQHLPPLEQLEAEAACALLMLCQRGASAGTSPGRADGSHPPTPPHPARAGHAAVTA